MLDQKAGLCLDRLKDHNAKTSKSFREAACEIVKACGRLIQSVLRGPLIR
jgi:hypothetical protein